jgi:hypothetical protein
MIVESIPKRGGGGVVLFLLELMVDDAFVSNSFGPTKTVHDARSDLSCSNFLPLDKKNSNK